MNKVTELYKENEHGTELVKDIERVLNLQTRDDQYTPSPRAKEYLKQCVNLIKGQQKTFIRTITSYGNKLKEQFATVPFLFLNKLIFIIKIYYERIF